MSEAFRRSIPRRPTFFFSSRSRHTMSKRDWSSDVCSSDLEETGVKLRRSFAGHLGRFIEPVIAPLGFDWKMGIGIVASFAAREVFLSAMSTVYNLGKYRSEERRVGKECTLLWSRG